MEAKTCDSPKRSSHYGMVQAEWLPLLCQFWKRQNCRPVYLEGVKRNMEKTSQQSLTEINVKILQCPFETIRKFKTGYVIKCPRSTQVSWCSEEGKDESILESLKVKRDCGCVKCRAEMRDFLKGEI